MKSGMEFRENGGDVEVWIENKLPPFNDIFLGILSAGQDRLYRFNTNTTYRHLITIAEKVSEINTAVEQKNRGAT